MTNKEEYFKYVGLQKNNDGCFGMILGLVGLCKGDSDNFSRESIGRALTKEKIRYDVIAPVIVKGNLILPYTFPNGISGTQLNKLCGNNDCFPRVLR